MDNMDCMDIFKSLSIFGAARTPRLRFWRGADAASTVLARRGRRVYGFGTARTLRLCGRDVPVAWYKRRGRGFHIEAMPSIYKHGAFHENEALGCRH